MYETSRRRCWLGQAIRGLEFFDRTDSIWSPVWKKIGCRPPAWKRVEKPRRSISKMRCTAAPDESEVCLSNLSHNLSSCDDVAFSVDLRRVGLRVPENGLGGFQAKLAANVGRPTVPKSVRCPLLDAGLVARDIDWVTVIPPAHEAASCARSAALRRRTRARAADPRRP